MKAQCYVGCNVNILLVSGPLCLYTCTRTALHWSNVYTHKNWATPPARCELYQTEKFEADELNLCGKLVNWPVAMMGISLKNRNLFSPSVAPSSLPIVVPRRTHIRSLNFDFFANRCGPQRKGLRNAGEKGTPPTPHTHTTRFPPSSFPTVPIYL